MEAALDPSFLTRAMPYILAASICGARIGGLMTVFPGFIRLGLSGILRGAVGLVLTLVLIPIVKESWAQSDHPAGEMVLLIFKEAIVGMTVGLVLGVPFWAAEAAGSFIDLQRAASMGNLIDPSNVDEANITATLFSLLMLAMFYGAGGMTLVLGTLYDSYAIWPVGKFLPLFSANAGLVFLGLLDRIFSMGIMLVIPLVLILLIADISLALVSRASPNLHVFDLSLSVKNLLVVILLLPYLSFLSGYMSVDIGWLTEIKALFEAMAGSPPK